MADEPIASPAPASAKPRLLERIDVPSIIDLTLIFGLFCIVILWFLRPPSGAENQLLTALVTGWLTLTTTIVNFHRGSSAGSKAKDDAMLKNPPTLTNQPEPKP